MRLRPKTIDDFTHDDKAQVERMLAGDEEAFEDFFEAYYRGLYRFALARVRRDDQLARDLAQTSLCRAIANLETYRGEASLSAWLYTICRHELSRHYRRQKNAPKPVELTEDDPEIGAALDSLPASFAGPEEDLRRKEVVGLVHAVLDRLPARYGDALEWKYFHGLSVKEIATRLKVGPKAAESILTRARQAFRDALNSVEKQERLERAFPAGKGVSS